MNDYCSACQRDAERTLSRRERLQQCETLDDLKDFIEEHLF